MNTQNTFGLSWCGGRWSSLEMKMLTHGWVAPTEDQANVARFVLHSHSWNSRSLLTAACGRGSGHQPTGSSCGLSENPFSNFLSWLLSR